MKKKPLVVIVIPTYNERENIQRTVPEVLAVLDTISTFTGNVLVVDGNSPDGTGEAVRQLSKEDPRVRLLLEKEKAGLGAAYIYAMQYAMTDLRADFVMEFDSDGQHNPQDIPRLLAAIQEGADCAVGTRFMQGGGIPKEWGWHRKFFSFFGNLYARLCLGMWGYHDITSGFRVTRVDGVLNAINLNGLLSKRFAYKMDLYYRVFALGARIVEVPIQFRFRDEGVSKQQLLVGIRSNDVLDPYRVVMLILWERTKTFRRFSVVGVTGALVQFSVFLLLRPWLLSLFPREITALIADLVAIEASILSNYTLNRRWTFSDRDGGTRIRRISLFHLSSVGSIISQLLVLWLGVMVLTSTGLGASLFALGIVPKYQELLLVALGIGVGLLINYHVYSRVIWRKNRY